MSTTSLRPNFFTRYAHAIVRARRVILLLTLVLMAFCFVSSSWVRVDESFASFLSEDAEARRGLKIMAEEFTTYGTAQLMVEGVSESEAQTYADEIAATDGVAMVTFDLTEHHYKDSSALYDVTFASTASDEGTKAAYEQVKALFAGKTLYVSSSIGSNMNTYLIREMTAILLIIAAVVVAVLIFTSQTYAEVAVLVLTFAAAAILQQGTNFLLGTISFVSNAVAVVLQLALSVDYAIIFCNRYKEEHAALAVRPAVEAALAKAVPEILSSSLTTIAGLTAMTFMKFRLGADLGFVLIKAIVCSLLSVFVLMPALLVALGKWMDRTRHRSFVPKIPFVGRFAYRSRFVVPVVFLVVFIGAFAVYRQCNFAYSEAFLSAPRKNEAQLQSAAIHDRFGESNALAVLVPSGDYEKEQALLSELAACDEVKSAMGLASIEALNGYRLGDRVSATEFAALAGMDDTTAQALFAYYAGANGEQSAVTEAPEAYRAPLIDLFLFLHDRADDGSLTLDEAQRAQIDELYDQLAFAREQLQGERYSRLVLTLSLPVEGADAFAFLDRVHVLAEQYYPAEDVVTVGESTNAYDFQRSFEQDNLVVTLLSLLLVTVILLFTFRSLGMPLLLILVIQGSICINFAITKIVGSYVFFLCYLIVTAIQMGANIDYAIVISSRFRDLRETHTPRQSIIETMNLAFPTVITSGTMMVVAGLLIGWMVSEPIIAGIGHYVGTGTIITLVLVMFVLPQLLLFGEGLVTATELPAPERATTLRRRIACGALAAAGVFALVAAPLGLWHAHHDRADERTRTAAVTQELDALSEIADRLDANLDTYDATALQFAEHAVTDAVGSEQLAAGEAQLANGEAQYSAGAAQLQSAKEQYAAGQAQLEAGRAEYAAGQEQLEAAKAQYADGEAQLAQVKPIYDLVNPIYQNYLQLQAQYDAAIAAGDLTLAGRLTPLVYTQRLAFESELAGTGYSIASLIQAYQDGEAQLAEGAAEIAAGEQRLAAAEQQLAEGQAQLDDAAAQIAAGEQELAAAKGQLDVGRGQVSAGRATLEDNRAALAEDLTALDAYSDDASRLQAGMTRLMAETDISARTGDGATNAAVISAARQALTDAARNADTLYRTRLARCVTLALAAVAALGAALLTRRRTRAGYALLLTAAPLALAAALIGSAAIAPLPFAAAITLLAAVAFGAVVLRG